MTARRDPEGTQRRILDAARREFSAHGPAGARIDRIAREAEVNKRMLYHYFGNKEALFEAVLDDAVVRLELVGDDVAARLAELAEHPDTLRLWTWRALEDAAGGSDANWGNIAQALSRGAGLGDHDHRALALLAAAIVPAVFSGLSQEVTGSDPDSEAFRQGQARVLAQLITTLDREKPRFRYRW